MRFTEFVSVVTSRWRIIVACVVVAMAVAGVTTYLTTPVYTAQATVYLSVEPVQGRGDGTVVLTTSDLETYQSILGTPAVLDPLRKDLGMVEGHPIDVEASVSSSTSIVDITARSSSPQEAAEVANGIGPHLADVAGDFSTVITSSNNRVVSRPLQPASVPTSPTSPNLRNNLALALLGGLVLGVGLALVRHALDTKVRSEEDIKSLSDAPVLATLPAERTSGGVLLSIEHDPHGQHAESVRRLRTNLLFVDVTTGRHSFVVTSAVPEEGKTTTAVNLALAMADAGTKTLLVDADLRSPSVADVLGIEGAVGLTTVLLGHATPDEVIHRWGASGVHVMPAGQVPPNPSELLGSQPMEDLFATLVEDYDFVIVDSPPVLPVVDAVIVQRLTGGILMVAGHERTKKRDLASAMKQLSTVDAAVSGFALNFAPARGHRAYGYGGETKKQAAGRDPAIARKVVPEPGSPSGRGRPR
ncbi:polysaccharide biosynthesis tyrosine autokinase [Janibacter indicus]|uniref:non-specific protein-tyrosine kinase n=1 Tax=Janibacter indicus TaxID=857417 RepID=A0A1W1ZPI5_9MICO|nr:polysaccharide biosynthesis tyrosine autokinase [Janibacter indicus]SMC50470.1 capsular exopolysaccharide family [Janibacter indicus]